MRRSVLVTGATSGVGRGTALRLAKAGFEVFATARDAEKAEKLRAEAAERDVVLRTVLLDVADAASCHRACAQVAEATGGGPWALVNNAGIPLAGAIEDLDDAAVRYLLEVNVVGAARMARLLLPGMRRRGDGRIVNVSSLAGRVAAPGMGWYCAGKSALGAVNDVLRMEAGPGGVRVVIVEAGAYASAMQTRAADALAALAANGRTVFGEMYRVAEAALRESATRLPDDGPVVAAVCRALFADRPRHRYVVGRQARMGLLADALVPVRVKDHVKRVALGAEAHPVVEYAARRWCTPW
ncbi:SDR family NAD(P)-dependent oxidoreductase [Streptomyces sp. RS10V-4]|uniref:SDR family NAD(P)-dependent oxidoreductase n=1 Tax=Streptomyces rhizoryzae TaxID=2932493 RepID=UPI002002CEF9|nr:SDR family NAD(P)-dependent oxidoreductase [Streptomyces rhizoryzae]MCK7622225.1 SDR family NAD(P)-dependent oxidoreductase [Streptomyces rhizoryzae]